ncbi:putative histone acetyltransferase type B catalytic subunit [Acorus gramineus]|uniref:histone acetyltransferase n=1 Tax=Acorus gramineus TaxID=55184 RepID=A0AAV9APY7_ACOGR|nr:putative histone acetyltransferase type B catalytic subunit [Acorus gramineus]
MALKKKGEQSSEDSKKRKRVGFAKIDAGIEANECIKVFLVSKKDPLRFESVAIEQIFGIVGCVSESVKQSGTMMCFMQDKFDECFTVVSSAEEVGAENSLCVNPVDLNQFFDEEGKIYGFKDLKIKIWLSSISFLAYADITFESTSDGGKGITDLKLKLQNIFGESLLDNREEFLQSFTTERDYVGCLESWASRSVVSSGEVICSETLNTHNDKPNTSDSGSYTIEVIRMELRSMPIALLYSRLMPLAFLFIDGSSPIDISDPRWEIYLVIKKMNYSGETNFRALGFATVYRFYRYPESWRLRISQILVLPPYQGQGHGRHLLESINTVSISKNIYDVTAEEPSDYLKHVRDCVDTMRLLSFEPTTPALEPIVSQLKQTNLSKRISKFRLNPPSALIESARDKLKINKKQFLRCWDALIYLSLDQGDHKSMENYRNCVLDRMRADVLGKDVVGTAGKRLIEVPNNYDHEFTFVVFRSRAFEGSDGLEKAANGEDQASQEEQFIRLVDERLKEIAGVASKVSMHRRSCAA